MQKNNSRIWLGAGLIIVGLLILMDQFRWIYFRDEYVVATAFSLIGLALLTGYGREKVVWKLIVGLGLLFIGSMIFLESSRILSDDYTGMLVLWMLAAAFLAVYLRDRKHWWAVIPGGILLTIGATVGLEATFWRMGHYSGSLFFLGVALTFGFLYFIRSEQNRLSWAIWPAGGAMLICVLTLLDQWFYYIHFEDYIAPAALILIGLYLIGRNFSSRHQNGNGAEVTT